MAKGILMERHRVGPQEAFDMLVAHSQKHHTRVVDVARAIVAAAADGAGGRGV
jgi:AmiR/NasT family two-component response regulator